MKDIIKLDVESKNLTVLEALATVEMEIETLKLGGESLLKIVHGYGSKGVGGNIKKALLAHLKILKKHKKICDFFACEKFCITHKNYKIYIKKYPNLLVDGNIKNLNPGATIVIL